LPHVSLNVVGHVVREPTLGVDAAHRIVVDARVTPRSSKAAGAPLHVRTGLSLDVELRSRLR
jgi:hypothetical protein